MENNKKVSILNNEYIKIFTEISAWIIGPILISLFIGNYFDNKLNTTPWILGVSLALSFTISMIKIVKIASKYSKNDMSVQTNDKKRWK